MVHAIERLRWVAGARWAPARELAEEAGWALAELAEAEPLALVPACRRLVERHPGCGPLWWLAASVLSSPEPADAAVACAMALADDRTEELVDEALPAGARAVRRGSVGDVAGATVVVVSVDALGGRAGGGVDGGGAERGGVDGGGAEGGARGGIVVDPADARLVQVATELAVPVWAVAGVGRVLPTRMWGVVVDRLSRLTAGGSGATGAGATGSRATGAGATGSGAAVVVGLEQVAMVVGPTGAVPPASVASLVSCGEPAELLR